MITSLFIRNFKCFESQGFELGNLTLLSGLNGTGKSSVLQALLLLRQSHMQSLLQKAEISLNGDLVQLGKARDVFYEAATTGEFGFDLNIGGLQACWRFGYDREADVVRAVTTTVPDAVYDASLFKDSFHYLSAERVGPRVSFTTSDYAVRQHRQLGVRGEYTSHFLNLFGNRKVVNEAMAHPKEQSLTLKSQVEAWMGEVSPGVRIDLTDYANIDTIGLQYSFAVGSQVSNSYRSTNVGFGITYTLPVLVALLASGPDDLVMLENPEAHLHPRGQVQMGDLIARVAGCGVQVIVESHSDHVLNGVRIAIRQGRLSPDQLRLYFLTRAEESELLSSQVISPHVDRQGRIDQWPDGFFDEWDKSLEKLLWQAQEG